MLHSLISADYSNMWVKLKRGGDGWLTGINSFAHSLHFEFSCKSHKISFFQLSSVYYCVSLQSPSASEHPLVSDSFRAPSSVINDFLVTLPLLPWMKRGAHSWYIIAYSMREGIRYNIGCSPLYQSFRKFWSRNMERFGLRRNFPVKVLDLQIWR